MTFRKERERLCCFCGTDEVRIWNVWKWREQPDEEPHTYRNVSRAECWFTATYWLTFTTFRRQRWFIPVRPSKLVAWQPLLQGTLRPVENDLLYGEERINYLTFLLERKWVCKHFTQVDKLPLQDEQRWRGWVDRWPPPVTFFISARQRQHQIPHLKLSQWLRPIIDALPAFLITVWIGWYWKSSGWNPPESSLLQLLTMMMILCIISQRETSCRTSSCEILMPDVFERSCLMYFCRNSTQHFAQRGMYADKNTQMFFFLFSLDLLKPLFRLTFKLVIHHRSLIKKDVGLIVSSFVQSQSISDTKSNCIH